NSARRRAPASTSPSIPLASARSHESVIRSAYARAPRDSRRVAARALPPPGHASDAPSSGGRSRRAPPDRRPPSPRAPPERTPGPGPPSVSARIEAGNAARAAGFDAVPCRIGADPDAAETRFREHLADGPFGLVM